MTNNKDCLTVQEATKQRDNNADQLRELIREVKNKARKISIICMVSLK
jgi:hypothetical protein